MIQLPHRRPERLIVAALAAAATVAAVAAAPSAAAAAQVKTVTPIKHLVVIVGENHTFDNVFGTYQPPTGQTVRNLLSEGIVTASGGFGPNVSRAAQLTAQDTSTDPGHYTLTPIVTGRYRGQGFESPQLHA